MPIPDYQTLMLPILRFAGDGQEHSIRDAIDHLANQFNLTVDELKELLPSGQQEVFNNRVGWARTYMKKAGLLETTRRGYFRITRRGAETLSKNLQRIDVRFLEGFEEFRQFRALRHTKETESRQEQQEAEATPRESLEIAYKRLREDLAVDLLQQTKAASPKLFENIIIELLLKMGYGGSKIEAGRAIGRSGDEGIDGYIKEDRLGLDVIYIQAKRWDNTVGRPEVQRFAGALQGQRARKGIMITTSTFSQDAKEYTSRIDSKIVLIEGEQLAQLMIEHSIGVSSIAEYQVKKIDYDYFIEE